MQNNTILTTSASITSKELSLVKGYNYFSNTQLGFGSFIAKKGWVPTIQSSNEITPMNVSLKTFGNVYPDYLGNYSSLKYFSVNNGNPGWFTKYTYSQLAPLGSNQTWTLMAKFILNGDYLSLNFSKNYSSFGSFKILASLSPSTKISTIVSIQNVSQFPVQSI